ncbi:bifunctional diaminohydroxyphosphoribosylaminopyrimidine deaminase/5-amino-6-(5-phosphoribosylamino)uracil reductase RibD [Paracoccus aerodenitrificans]|uniref:bifunctional diaminohydroxyphosphoribosylaminopyrimidine deaminase/5-amino-6-(5-phosphoribosylamino)uracil reductase RibD n=1 Tax=Paracoccus aerodenitrificans TaxID=3017781 RepID=UPI0022F00574|nr:bifunctional diaminohydroxyphosphoribosylaminopyrimidine deaminase/5-amino-6-(5-phosphoribosylamino)uracil reductase RibD [Paracoccus aerodenitrificans]WBU65682.1 bifunctional diaminohydroxyphosphoribosylaminopyrimidine deaminase/5-amino-6-(5-phosphoribosylamino)uracil reductase RibD [Paracoccus aerodenitrificans]
MDHALRLAVRGLGNVWPNPAVGCVLVRDGRIVGRGWTQPGGRPHAERMALQQAGEAARGATAYVTLEPCAHHGRSSPCADALIAAGVVRVVSALTDPDPRTAGQGHRKLRDAGIEVTEHICSAEAARLQRGFLNRIEHGRPMITLKLASSLDGRIATASGESQWITGPEARRHVHLLRSRHDAIMVGGGTAHADRPSLNVRGISTPRQPARVIVSSRTLPELPAEDDRHGPLWQVSGPLDEAMKSLAERGVTRVFCEGGGQLAASLLAADLVDDLVFYSAGLVLGAAGRPSVGDLPCAALREMPRFRLVRSCPVGADLFQLWTRR